MQVSKIFNTEKQGEQTEVTEQKEFGRFARSLIKHSAKRHRSFSVKVSGPRCSPW